VGWENEFASNAEAFTRTYSRTRQLEQWVFMGAPGHPVLRRICDHVDAHATTVRVFAVLGQLVAFYYIQWVFMGAPGHPVLRRICDHVDAHATTVRVFAVLGQLVAFYYIQWVFMGVPGHPVLRRICDHVDAHATTVRVFAVLGQLVAFYYIQWVFMGAPGHPVLRRICDHVDAHATTVRVCELSFGGNINASALRLRQKHNQLNCLHHYGLEVLNNPVPPPPVRSTWWPLATPTY
jgi:mannosyltransferase OCH1-like enzyme